MKKEWQKHDLCLEFFPVGSLGCNCTIIYHQKTKEALIVDPGNDPEYLLKQIERKELKVIALLHTHAHFDHIGGSQKIKEQTQAPLYLHAKDYQLYQRLPEQMSFFGMMVESPGKIDHELQDEQTFLLPAQTKNLTTLFTPGHTQGSCCFYLDFFNVPLLLSGDTLFYRSIGRTDLWGGDQDTILQSIQKRLFTLPDETLVIPGHGPMTFIHEEKRKNPFVGTQR